MKYVYYALQLTATFGGSVWCLVSIAFRWHSLTHKYGRHELFFWYLYINIVVFALAVAAIIAVWGVEVAVWEYRYGS